MTLLERLRETRTPNVVGLVTLTKDEFAALLAVTDAAKDAERVLFDWAKEFPGLVTPWERLSKAIAPLTTDTSDSPESLSKEVSA